jgi:hypothetical protein
MSRYDILCGRTPKYLDVIAPPAETIIYKARVKNISEGTEINTGLGGLRAFFKTAMVYYCGKEIEIFPVKVIQGTIVEGWWVQKVAPADRVRTTSNFERVAYYGRSPVLDRMLPHPAPTPKCEEFYYHESWLDFL